MKKRKNYKVEKNGRNVISILKLFFFSSLKRFPFSQVKKEEVGGGEYFK